MPTDALIGAAGGVLVSSDGRLTITVPAGALASPTSIGIQPVTATAPGALGSAYRLTPEGVAFAQPVTLTFVYSADEAAATHAPTLRVATREASGRWLVAAATNDSVQRKLTAPTSHFSEWSLVAGLQLAPASAVVLTGKELTLDVITCDVMPNLAPAGVPVLLECRHAPSAAITGLAVNGIPRGNNAVGVIVDLALPGGGAGHFLEYTAPVTVPAQNPVAVSAQYVGLAGATTTLVSNIKVVDRITAYQGTVSSRIDLTVNGQTASYETSANVRYAYNAALSIGGDTWYDGTGTALVRARPFGCSEGSASGPLSQGAALTLHGEGPLAGTYALAGGAVVSMSLTCGNPPATVTAPVAGGYGAAGNGVCPDLRFSDPSTLSGEWVCNEPGNSQRTTWRLRAVE